MVRLPNAQRHYQIHGLCRVPATLGKGLFALGKGLFALGKTFAECNTRQTPLGKAPDGKGCFVECQISGTRQRLCRVTLPSAKLPRGVASGGGCFAECLTAGTRQNSKVCRVPGPGTRQSSRHLTPHVAALPSARSLALGKVSRLCRVPGP